MRYRLEDNINSEQDEQQILTIAGPSLVEPVVHDKTKYNRTKEQPDNKEHNESKKGQRKPCSRPHHFFVFTKIATTPAVKIEFDIFGTSPVRYQWESNLIAGVSKGMVMDTHAHRKH